MERDRPIARRSLDEPTLARQIGICFGLGLPLEKTAEHIGTAPNTVRALLKRQGTLIQTVRAETEAVAAQRFNKKIQQLEERAENKLGLQETKNAIRKELYDKMLARLQKEVELDDEILAKLARIGLEFTDEKPAQTQKRITSHTETHELSAETLDRLDRMLADHGYRPALDAPRLIEAVVISSGSE